jgi:GTP:adenosylcobinamide-phosphate guanylyltransferase
MSLRLECVVLAGGRPEPGDDLWPHTGGRPKALLELGGRPMVRWVIDALVAARSIERIILVGLERKALPELPEAITLVPDAGSVIANLYAGVAELSQPGPAAFCWSDVPLIRPGMIDRFVATTDDPELDINAGLVDRRAIQARFPGAEDLWIRLREGRFIASSFGLFHTRHAARARRHFEALAPQRKNLVRQARYVGIGLLLRYLLGRLSIPELERHIERRFEIRCRLRIVDSPELGLDVDRSIDLECCRSALASRHA